jgi:hypothetical protein
MLGQTFQPAGVTLEKFHRSSALVRLILGPMQSGKRTSCAHEIILKAADQTRALPRDAGQLPSRMRWLVLSGSREELLEETIPAWHQIFPIPSSPGAEDGYGSWDRATLRHELKPWRGLVLEIIFLGLNRDADRQRFSTIRACGVWIDRARDIRESDFDQAIRIAASWREPSTRLRAPWQGVILSSRMPRENHWLKRRFVDEVSDGYQLFRQPGGLTDKAENPRGFDYNAEAQGLPEDMRRTEIDAEWGRAEADDSWPAIVKRSYLTEAA